MLRLAAKFGMSATPFDAGAGRQWGGRIAIHQPDSNLG
jgi:hypothetical protein